MDNPKDYHFSVDVSLAILFIACITALLILLVVDSIYELSEPVSINTIKESAWTACKTQAENQLQVPHRNAQEYTSDKVRVLTEQNHYEVEVHYTDGRIYQCDLAPRTDGDWFLKSLYVK